MSQLSSRELEAKWGAMTKVEKLYALGAAQLADAERRDKRFPRESNVANFWYGAEATYVYGGGKR